MLSHIKLAKLNFNLIYLLLNLALHGAFLTQRLLIAFLLGKKLFDLLVQLGAALLLLVFLAEQLGDSRFGSEDVALGCQGLVSTTFDFGFRSRDGPCVGRKLGLERLDCLNQRLAMLRYLAKRNFEVSQLVGKRLLMPLEIRVIALELIDSGIALVVDGLELLKLLFRLVFLLDGLAI